MNFSYYSHHSGYEQPPADQYAQSSYSAPPPSTGYASNGYSQSSYGQAPPSSSYTPSTDYDNSQYSQDYRWVSELID